MKVQRWITTRLCLMPSLGGSGNASPARCKNLHSDRIRISKAGQGSCVSHHVDTLNHRDMNLDRRNGKGNRLRTTPENAFIKSIHAAAMAAGGSPSEWRSEGRTSIRLVWFPEIPHGLLAYDSDRDRWQQLDGSKDAHLALTITDNGCVSICEGDDDGVFLETTLEAGDELNELLEFYSTALAQQIGTSAIASRTIGQCVEEVLLLIPSADGDFTAVNLVGYQIDKNYPEIAAAVDAWFAQDWGSPASERLPSDGMPGEDLHESYTEWLRHLTMHDAIGPSRDPESGYLVLTPNGGIHYAGMLKAGSDSYATCFPAIALRLRKTCAAMWMFDYLKHASEAEGLIPRIFKEWKQLPRLLGQLSVAIPSDKRDQVASSLAARTARMAYLQCLEGAMHMREPMSRAVVTYQKRARAAKGLHTELLDDMHAMQSPLPFFLEYPYRLYRRAEDPLDKVTAAQRLLSVLIKVPLFLVIEELISIGAPTGEKLMSALGSRPPSDGTLLGMHRDVCQSPDADSLTLFRPVLEVMRNRNALERMVQTRNRLSHAPFVSAPFLEAIGEGASFIMDSLRDALRDCRFLIPTHFKVVSGETILAAEDICSSDSCFQQIQFAVELPVKSFPCGRLIAWRGKPEGTVSLERLMTTKTVTEKTLDFGLFDRMENHHARFTFLRSE